MIKFDPKNRGGIFQKTVRVQTNGEPREAVLRIRGRVIADPTLLRKKIGDLQLNRAEFNFGEVLDTEIRRDSIMIRNNGSHEMELEFDKSELDDNLKLEIAANPLAVGESSFIYTTFQGDKSGKYGFKRMRVKFWDSNNPDKTIGNLLISYSQSEDFDSWTDEQKSHAPGIRFRQTLINFGEAHYSEEIECEFSFSNPGNGDLLIRDIKLSSFVEILSYDERVPAGGEGRILLRLNLERSVGDFTRYITVISNCPTQSSKRLSIKGKVIDR
ncbi:MAG: DUF1573 domain-containing protein [Candidatus Cloacimonetes bacterium]|nr:DUF1573 domain-containing protein [Candidatus Cloacimonadota bacterium]